MSQAGEDGQTKHRATVNSSRVAALGEAGGRLQTAAVNQVITDAGPNLTDFGPVLFLLPTLYWLSLG
jgi:hypothetical protein